MKEVNPRDTGVQTVGNSESGDFSINEQALDMAMDAFTQYSNPIESIVREITSNGFDAHDQAQAIRDQEIELVPWKDITRSFTDYRKLEHFAEWTLVKHQVLQYSYLRDWEETGVTVRMSPRYGDEQKIEIEDKGVGMAPMGSPVEPNISIYTQFFASTKRDTNDQLGFFGVGAKSPLGYTDMFEVVSTWCGKTYHYVVSMGSDRPQIDLVDVQETDEPNGTTVRISIDSTSDWRTFKKAARKQLAYFPNVIYEGSLAQKIDNDFQIYEGENFVFRTDSPFDQLHLCIGGVYYPLDYESVGLKEPRSYRSHGWDVPMALNFDIGEIEIVWNRENVKYTEDTIDKINAKIQKVKSEIQDIYNERYSDISDIEEWLEAWQISQNNTLKLGNGVEVELTDKFLEQSVPDFPAFEKLDRVPRDPFYLVKAYKKIDEGYVDQSGNILKFKDFYFRDNLNLAWVDTKYTPRTNRYINWDNDFSTFYLVKKKARLYTPSDIDDPELREKIEKRYVRRYSNNKKKDYSWSSFGDSNDYVKNIPREKLEQMMTFEKKLLEAFRDKCFIYNDQEPTEEFIELDKKRKKKNPGSTSTKTVNKEDTFPAKRFKRASRHSNSDWSRTRIKWSRIEDPDLIVYGHRDDANDLEIVGRKLTNFSSISGSRYYGSASQLNQDRAMVLKIAKKRAKYFEALDYAYHVEDYFDLYHGWIRRHFTRKKVNNIQHPSDVPSKLEDLFPRVNQLTSRLNTLTSPISHVGQVWLQEYDEEDYVDPKYVRMAKELRGWVLKYPLFSSINPRNRSMPDGTTVEEEIQSYIQSKGNENPLLTYRNYLNNQQNNDES